MGGARWRAPAGPTYPGVPVGATEGGTRGGFKASVALSDMRKSQKMWCGSPQYFSSRPGPFDTSARVVRAGGGRKR